MSEGTALLESLASEAVGSNATRSFDFCFTVPGRRTAGLPSSVHISQSGASVGRMRQD
jgi:hypothetical protein